MAKQCRNRSGWCRVVTGFVRVLLIGVLLLVGVGTAVAFPIPEHLEFELTFAGVTAGKAVQEVSRSGEEVHLLSTARSADWLKYLFPVEDRIESILRPDPSQSSLGVPVLYRERIREGKTRRQKDLEFNRRALTVTAKDLIRNKVATAPISKRTFDPLSCFFYIRSIPLTVGTSTFIDIFDGKKLWNTEVQIVRRETIKIPLGTFKTILVKPLLKSEGIFARTGDMHIWITDDERRIPIRMKSKVVVGSISVTLVGGSYWKK